MKTNPTTRVIVHEKSSLAPPGQSLGDGKGFRWIGADDISAEDLLAGGEGSKTELKQDQAVKRMSERRKDHKGRILKTGESQRKDLQYLMGHSDASVTLNVYSHANYAHAADQLTKIKQFRQGADPDGEQNSAAG